VDNKHGKLLQIIWLQQTGKQGIGKIPGLGWDGKRGPVPFMPQHTTKIKEKMDIIDWYIPTVVARYVCVRA
jgi:hypothetical protein